MILANTKRRLTRRPLELEELIRLHECTGLRLARVVSGDDGVNTEGGLAARSPVKASVDAAEAERVSERKPGGASCNAPGRANR